MKEIRLTRYGFIRTPEKDFTDDGNRFTCFTIGQTGNMRISKTTYNGEVFISARMESNELSWEEYSSLPGYNALDALNGVAIDSVTEDQLEELAADCLVYEAAFLKKLEEVKANAPTLAEYTKYCQEVYALVEKDYNELMSLVTTGWLISLTDHDAAAVIKNLRVLKRVVAEYDVDEKAADLYAGNNAFTRNLLMKGAEHLYEYTKIKKFYTGEAKYIY